MGKMQIKTIQYDAIEQARYHEKPLWRVGREKIFLLFICAAAILYFLLIVLPIFSVLSFPDMKGIKYVLANKEVLLAVKLSLSTSLVTVFFIFILGTPVAFFLKSDRKNVLARMFEIVVTIPTVLPPAVAGIALLLAFGRNGLIGKLLADMNIDIGFTPAAVILAQFFVSSGFYIQVLKASVDEISPEIFEASYICGAGRVETFVKIIVPMLKKPILAGAILSWTRSVGEFGATIMFAGNILGKTRTLPLQIYTLIQTDISLSAAVSVILLLVSFIMLFVIKIWIKE